MKKLLIVESPAKIKTISKFLGKDFKIMSTVGHIKDLPTKQVGIHHNGTYTIDYVVLDKKQKIIDDICKAAKTSDEIFLGPDPDREGEIIAFHIGQEIEQAVKKKSKIHRITFNEITKEALTEALQNPSAVDMKKVAAQQARRILDRWVGYEVSPILWRKIAKGLSAGRVQSVALKLICEREEAIRAFKAEEYWSITILFVTDSVKIAAPLTHINNKKADIPNEETAKKISAELRKTSFSITSIEDKQRTKNPLPPFMTSTLQQAAFNRLGFSVKKTMQVAQQLYEGIPLEDPHSPVALITYMRTDSLRLSQTALEQARSFITKTYTKEYLPPKSIQYAKSSAKAQDAHEAIRPVNVAITPEYAQRYLSSDAAKLYTLIWQRFVACQMKAALYAQRQVTIQGGKFMCKVTGSTLLFDGFLRVYGLDEDDEKEEKNIIPPTLQAQQPVQPKTITPKQHFTQPPARFTEASLVKELEKEGIGRPSTYATIMNTIRAREYTVVDSKKRFSPTELGMTVTKMLNENLPKIMDYKFTAHMEEDLDKIAHGTAERDTVLDAFYQQFEKDLATFAGEAKRPHEATGLTCPSCKQGDLVIRFGKSGPFVGCSTYPACTFTSNFTRKEDGTIELTSTEAPTILEEACPNCGKPLRQMVGRYGPFISCSGYPECKYIKQVVANFPCPLDSAEVIRKQWKGSVFWGCVNYPKCKFTIFSDIEQTPCPVCKTPYLLKKAAQDGTVTLHCSQKECTYNKK